MWFAPTSTSYSFGHKHLTDHIIEFLNGMDGFFWSGKTFILSIIFSFILEAKDVAKFL